ncbi:MAG TPA: hypothetical protein VML55_00500 [Planctomycetaceae bacterium]|nr:hypothetical protein [Planctomycetaceae bacterium]
MRRPYAIPADTSVDDARVYFATLKRLGNERRLAMGASLSKSLRRRIEAGVRMRHPDYCDDDIRKAVMRILIGEDLYRRCFPGCNVAP